jgi:hypothetical protein
MNKVKSISKTMTKERKPSKTKGKHTRAAKTAPKDTALHHSRLNRKRTRRQLHESPKPEAWTHGNIYS